MAEKVTLLMDIDLFEGPRGKLVEPELQKVIVLLWLFFVNFTMVQLVYYGS